MKPYILTITGGGGFSIEVPNNPTVLHAPNRAPVSVFSLFLSEEHLEELTRILQCMSVNYALRAVDESSEEQEEEQRKLLGLIGQNERAWPSLRCPSCFWFDPLLKGEPCGEVGWPLSFSEEAYRNNERAKKDLDECPVRPLRCPE